MDTLPRLYKIERQRPNTVAMRGKFSGEIPRISRIKEHALGSFPSRFTGLLTQIRENLIQIWGKQFRRAVRTRLQCVRVKFCVEYDRASMTVETKHRFPSVESTLSLLR